MKLPSLILLALLCATHIIFSMEQKPLSIKPYLVDQPKIKHITHMIEYAQKGDTDNFQKCLTAASDHNHNYFNIVSHFLPTNSPDLVTIVERASTSPAQYTGDLLSIMMSIYKGEKAYHETYKRRLSEMPYEDVKRLTPLHVATYLNDVETAEFLLIQNRSLLNQLPAVKDELSTEMYGKISMISPLAAAINKQHEQMCHYLLSYKEIDINSPVQKSPVKTKSLLEWTSRYGTPTIFKMINKRLQQQYARQQCSAEILKRTILKNNEGMPLSLLRAIDFKLNGQTQPIHVTIEMDDLPLFSETCLHPHTNINHLDTNGDTPLIIAVKQQNYKMMKILCSNGADRNIKNTDNKTALDYAKGEIKTYLEAFDY